MLGRFCVGDKFYLCDNKILCEYDYEERLLMASLEFPNKRSSSSVQQVKQPFGILKNICIYSNKLWSRDQTSHRYCLPPYLQTVSLNNWLGLVCMTDLHISSCTENLKGRLYAQIIVHSLLEYCFIHLTITV